MSDVIALEPGASVMGSWAADPAVAKALDKRLQELSTDGGESAPM